MSILIKDLQMPQGDEMLCINVYPDGKVCINLDLKCKQIATAVPVPPHGDLIDRDAMCDGLVRNNPVVIYAGCMPTIIPADEPTIGEIVERTLKGKGLTATGMP